jgi:hypothetical protein
VRERERERERELDVERDSIGASLVSTMNCFSSCLALFWCRTNLSHKEKHIHRRTDPVCGKKDIPDFVRVCVCVRERERARA